MVNTTININESCLDRHYGHSFIHPEVYNPPAYEVGEITSQPYYLTSHGKMYPWPEIEKCFFRGYEP
jgi:hypothetical protein